ncbi:MAG: DMT family transporter [Eubacterium sp.]|nr:DMT family transporter [Eubacterium sp.]
MGRTESGNRNKGILFILLAAFFFAMMTMFIRLSGDLPTAQKAFFRNFIACIAALAMLLRTPEKLRIGKGNIPFLLLRSACGSVGIFCNFYAVDHMNVADANMLNKLSPFFAIIFSALILKEMASRRDWICVALAFSGALLVIRPSFSMETVVALIGAAGGLGAGIAYTFVRLLGERGERGPMIVFFFSAFSSLLCLPFMVVNFVPMSGYQWAMLLLCGLSAMGGQLSITAAYTHAPAKEISVFDYSQVIFAALLAVVLFGELPDRLSIAGYAIIIGAALWRWRMNQRVSQKTAR